MTTMTTTRVPFVDLGRIHAGLKEAIVADVAELVDAGAFSNGPAVRELETAFAQFCGTAHAVGVASGLDALRLGLLALGLGPGDEVIAPANTFIATIEAIAQTGALPVLVDAGEDDYNLDVEAAAAAVTTRTRALLPVHLYGQLADMRAAGALARAHDLIVLEDACQAHGATRDGLAPGAQTAGAAFSFYPGKNLGAFGDAGALATDDAQLAATVAALREHGQRTKGRHALEGYTARLDTIQALVLLRKLPSLTAWNDSRRRAAARYADLLDGVGDLVLPPVAPGSDPVWHLFVVRTDAPVALADWLSEQGIATGRHYPEPPHLTAAYAYLGHRPGAFPVTEELATHGLSLPMFAGITDGEVDAVARAVRSYFDHV
jgi:dTDP-4-amino-4,6-dideoxygalactose transaminase